MEATNLRKLEEAVEKATGMSAKFIRDTPLSEHQERIRARDGQLNVRTTGTKPQILTTKEIDEKLDESLKTT